MMAATWRSHDRDDGVGGKKSLAMAVDDVTTFDPIVESKRHFDIFNFNMDRGDNADAMTKLI